MKLSEDNKLPLAMGSWYNVNSHKVLYLFFFVALFQPIQIHYTSMSLPHKIASKHCTLWSWLCCPHHKNAPFYFLAFFFNNEPRSLNFVDHVDVGHLCFLVHDHPQRFHISNQNFIVVMAIPITITTARTK
jgi:hypothetical protein